MGYIYAIASLQRAKRYAVKIVAFRGIPDTIVHDSNSKAMNLKGFKMNRNRTLLLTIAILWTLGQFMPATHSFARESGGIDIASRRELFVDNYLIDRLEGVRLVLHRPRDKGPVLKFDEPWEGPFCGYCTVIKDQDKYRFYYRGLREAGRDGSEREVTCYAESKDGINIFKPRLNLFAVKGSKSNNVILADAAPVHHNFSPLLDTRPGVQKDRRYKALGGTQKSGLIAYISADGIHWRKLRTTQVNT